MHEPTPAEELLEALGIFMLDGRLSTRPFHCEHDTLYVMADPERFTDLEKERLDVLGFFDSEEGTFQSYRFGSA